MLSLGIAGIDRIQSQLLEPAVYFSDQGRHLAAVIKTFKGQLPQDTLNRALRLASFNCAPHCISLLLQHGADPNSTVTEMMEWDDYLNPEEPLPTFPLALVIHGAYTMAASLGSGEEEDDGFSSKQQQSTDVLATTTSELSNLGDAEAGNANRDSDGNLSSRGLQRALDSMTTLLKKGANVDKAQEQGATALFMAASSRLDSPQMITLLLEHNADPNKKYVNPSTGIEMTPAEIAFKKRNVRAVTELETDRNVCASLSGAETLEKWSKLGDLMPADVLLYPGRQGTNFPLHAALLISEKLGKLSREVNPSKQELYQRASKKYETIACKLYEQINERTPMADLKRFIFEDEVCGRTAVSIASHIGSSEFMFTIREMMLDYWLGPSTTDSVIDRMFLHPLRYPLAFGLYNRCFWGTPRGRYFLDFVLYLLFLVIYTMVLRLGAVPFPSGLEVLLYVCVIGFVKNEVSQIREEGFRSYFSSVWNLMDMMMYAVFLACMTLRVAGIDMPDNAEKFGRTVYVMTASNSMLLWSRTLNLFTLNEYLGPLVRTIVKMLVVVVQFFVVVAVMFLGFGEGIFFLVRFFNPESTHNFGTTLLLLYTMLLGNFDFDMSEEMMPTFGPIIVGLFLVIGSILLLNLLIALMSHEFESVKEAAIQEYFFGIAETTLSYQKSMTRMPVPISIIDIPFFFLRRRYRMTLFCAVTFFTIILPVSAIVALLGGRRRRNLFLSELKRSKWATPKTSGSSENPLVDESAPDADDHKLKGLFRINKTRELRGPMPTVTFLPETVIRSIGAAEDSIAPDLAGAVSICVRELSDRLSMYIADTNVFRKNMQNQLDTINRGLVGGAEHEETSLKSKMDKVDTILTSKVEHLRTSFNARDTTLNQKLVQVIHVVNTRLDKLEGMISALTALSHPIPVLPPPPGQLGRSQSIRSSQASAPGPQPAVQMF